MTYRSSDLVRLTGFALIYALLAKLFLNFFSENNVIAIIWPLSGLAFAALLMGGKKYWPGIFIGAFVGNIMAGSTVGLSMSIASGNAMAAVASIFF